MRLHSGIRLAATILFHGLIVIAAALFMPAGCATPHKETSAFVPPVTGSTSDASDISCVPADLFIPTISDEPPAAGRRVRQTSPGYENTRVHHVLYLPVDWRPGGNWPVIIEYPGNGGYLNNMGDRCTGRVEDCQLGYGITGGRGFIWVAMPFINGEATANVETWWGTPPNYQADTTVEYCLRAVPYICQKYGGNPDRVLLAGFSRGAIACNYIGLHDDSIARLWRGFIAFSHYDGVISRWPFPRADRHEALRRLRRLNGRPQFICCETGRPPDTSLEATERYLLSTGEKAPWTFRSTGFRNHDDAWVLSPSPARTALREWVRDVLAESSTRPAQTKPDTELKQSTHNPGQDLTTSASWMTLEKQPNQ